MFQLLEETDQTLLTREDFREIVFGASQDEERQTCSNIIRGLFTQEATDNIALKLDLLKKATNLDIICNIKRGSRGKLVTTSTSTTRKGKDRCVRNSISRKRKQVNGKEKEESSTEKKDVEKLSLWSGALT
ncbi:10987_t:CDS:2, partial [Gigaspora rosea]